MSTYMESILTFAIWIHTSMLAFAVSFLIVAYSYLTYNLIIDELNTYCLCDNLIQRYIYTIEVPPICNSYCTM
jgi:hypothetical protein